MGQSGLVFRRGFFGDGLGCGLRFRLGRGRLLDEIHLVLREPHIDDASDANIPRENLTEERCGRRARGKTNVKENGRDRRDHHGKLRADAKDTRHGVRGRFASDARRGRKRIPRALIHRRHGEGIHG